MMDALCDPSVNEVIIKTSSQIGKTEILLCIIGYYIHHDPCPILLVQPTLDMAQAFSKDRLAPTIRDTPALQEVVGDTRSRKAESTILQKTFPGGHITMSGANSPASLASRPIRVVLQDEVDRFPASAGKEGDPCRLADKRCTTFWNHKKIKVSTPTIAGESRIDLAYQDSTQEIYSLQCPDCEEFQQIKRDVLVHRKIENKLVGVDASCRQCGCVHPESVWRTQPAKWVAQQEHTKRGFHLNEYVSPWRKWLEIELDFLEAKKSKETLKTFVNTVLGECWEDDAGEQIDADMLYNRREHYVADVPVEDVVLTASVDVQDDRVELQVEAWREDEENYKISYDRFYGDLSKPGIWDVLEKAINQQYSTPSGILLDLRLIMIDSGGHYTDEVYAFSKRIGTRRCIPIKGSSQSGKPVASFPRKRTEKGVYLTMIGTDTAKEIITARLSNNEPGPGYVHFPVSEQFDPTYFVHLTNERKVKKYVKGRLTTVWDAGKRRQEPFDLSVYNLAAVRVLQQHMGLKLDELSTSTEVIAAASATAAPTQRRKSTYW
tara:strand:- start:42130 stop:43773 length:1644 start_codon:yes stop_codon:yes gene_type:complete